MMRRTVIGVVAGLVSVAAGAGALAWGVHAGGRHGIVKRMISAALDDALEQAQVTPAQRQAIHAARDRALAAVEQARTDRRARLEEGLALFEADQPDPARVEALHQAGAAERERMREAIHQAIVEVHGILTPTQRKAVADYVRSHRSQHFN
jgi:Spy/CpxP family protein refolding chaperone